MSTQATLGSGGTDVYLGTVQHTNPLAAGGSYSTSGTFTAAADRWPPATTISSSPPNRPVAPPTDPDNEGVNLVYETDETNNAPGDEHARRVRRPVSPDLSVSSVGAARRRRPAAGQLAVSWTVTNTGANTGNVPITDSVYLSYDQVFDPTDRYLGSVTTSGRPGRRARATRRTRTFTLPAGFAGTFYVIVRPTATSTSRSRTPPTTARPLRRPYRSACRPRPTSSPARSRCPRTPGGPEHHHHLPGHQQRQHPGQRLLDRFALPLADPDLERQRPAPRPGVSGSEPRPRSLA